jgi:hypothetical protein
MRDRLLVPTITETTLPPPDLTICPVGCVGGRIEATGLQRILLRRNAMLRHCPAKTHHIRRR